MRIYKGSMSLFRTPVLTNEITVFVTTILGSNYNLIKTYKSLIEIHKLDIEHNKIWPGVAICMALCYSYSTGPGIYGSKPTESEGLK